MNPSKGRLSSRPGRVSVDVHISTRTVVKILVTATLVYVCLKLLPLFMTLFFAGMLAVTFYPLFTLLQRRGLPRWIGVMIIVVGIIGSTILLIMTVLPTLVDQISALIDGIPQLRQRLADQLPKHGEFRAMGEALLRDLTLPKPKEMLAPLVSVGQVAMGGFLDVVFIFVFTIYFLLDGLRAITWVLAFFSSDTRLRLMATGNEMAKLMSSYIIGQFLTSVICGVYTLIVLSALQVPAALTLATLAGIADVLPVLGSVLAAAPAILLALTVSPVTALIVATLYAVYHVVENYLLVPKVYGSRLRLSDLVVMISLMAAAAVAGTWGALAVLPLVASYPIIERIWLVDFLGRGVVKKHADGAVADGVNEPESTVF